MSVTEVGSCKWLDTGKDPEFVLRDVEFGHQRGMLVR